MTQIHREAFAGIGLCTSEYSKLHLEDENPDPNEAKIPRDKQLEAMKNHFANDIAAAVTISPDNDTIATFTQDDYREHDCFTSVDRKVLYKRTPWNKFVNIYAIAGTVIVVVLCTTLQYPLLLLGLPFIGLVNLLYVYKFASKDIYLGGENADGKLTGERVKPLTKKQKDLLTQVGKSILLSVDNGAPVADFGDPLPESQRNFKYIASLKKSNDYDTHPEHRRYEWHWGDIKQKLGLGDDISDVFSEALITEIKARLSEGSVELEKADKWIQGLKAKFADKTAAYGIKDKLLTPEEFAELYKHVNNIRFIREQILDYYAVLNAAITSYECAKSPQGGTPTGPAYDQAVDLMITLNDTLRYIETDVFQTTQKIFQYFNNIEAEKHAGNHQLANVLELFNSKLLEFAFLDKCATYFRDYKEVPASISTPPVRV